MGKKDRKGMMGDKGRGRNRNTEGRKDSNGVMKRK